MKQFFGAFFGSIVAALVMLLIVVGLIKSSINSFFTDDAETRMVIENSVLKIEIDGELYERERENPFKDLAGSKGGPFAEAGVLGLNTLIKKINTAKIDNRIKGIYLSLKSTRAGFASVQELRDALADFKKSGKFIYCYSEFYSQQEVFLASVASKVFVHPNGIVEWKGLYMGLLFFKKAFDKLDIDMQVFRHGKFKSAVEPFILDKMSPSNRYQSEIFVGSIWRSMLNAISTDRKISIDELNRMANRLEIRFPEDARGKLVDELAYEDEVISHLKKKTGIDEKGKLNFISIEKYIPEAKINSKLNATKIAVIYAVGSIMGGEGNDDQIGSARIARAIREARTDEKIKAIVLRVNSPGGSALASDVIWREMVLAQKIKPTVVSMGDVAASGGYYISCAADRIFAQPNTITGSIGVFGLLPNMQKMLENKLGITVDTINTNAHSDFGNTLRPVTEYEYEVIQQSVERIYQNFTRIVAQGRKMSAEQVDSIGQGRVWSGSDALKIGLVDELGGLDAAVAYAAAKAGLKEYKRQEFPKLMGPFDEIFGNKESELESRLLKRNLGTTYNYLKHLRHIMDMKGVQARLPFEIVLN